MSYIDGMVIPVTTSRREEFVKMMAEWRALLKEFGATRVVECWGDEVPDGKVTDFKRAVQATPDETVVFSWVEWPSKQARDAGNEKLMKDPRAQPREGSPMNLQRMIYGGFEVLADSRA